MTCSTHHRWPAVLLVVALAAASLLDVIQAAKRSEKCCQELGYPDGGGRSDVCAQAELPSCRPRAKGKSAKRFCLKRGARLCTQKELRRRGEAQGSGCGYEDDLVWSTTKCDKGKAWVVPANGTGSRQCWPRNNKAFKAAIVCCADVCDDVDPDLSRPVVSTLAGQPDNPGFADGVGPAAQFIRCAGTAAAPDGRTVYVADTENRAIRMLDLETLAVGPFAGEATGIFGGGFQDGIGEVAQYESPYGLALTKDGSKLYVADKGNNAVRVVDTATRNTATIAGRGALEPAGANDAIGLSATFWWCQGVALSESEDTLYVADTLNGLIRAIDLATAEVTTLAGKPYLNEQPQLGSDDGIGREASFGAVSVVLVLPGTNTLLVGDSWNGIRTLNTASLQVTTLAPIVPEDTIGFPELRAQTMVVWGNTLIIGNGNLIRTMDLTTLEVDDIVGDRFPGAVDGVGLDARLAAPQGFSFSGERLIFADSNNHAVRAIDFT